MVGYGDCILKLCTFRVRLHVVGDEIGWLVRDCAVGFCSFRLCRNRPYRAAGDPNLSPSTLSEIVWHNDSQIIKVLADQSCQGPPNYYLY